MDEANFNVFRNPSTFSNIDDDRVRGNLMCIAQDYLAFLESHDPDDGCQGKERMDVAEAFVDIMCRPEAYPLIQRQMTELQYVCWVSMLL